MKPTPYIETPFLGAAYYPEDWDESEIPRDIAKMKEAGIRCVRIGEFAWAKMEPKPGQYDFAWLHRVVDALHEAGIFVILGTPTACPPSWFIREYPEAVRTDIRGRRCQVGTRRHCCSSSPVYLAECRRIVTRLAAEFGRDEAVVGWQIDNELYGGDFALQCTCRACMKRFHDSLRKRYGTVEEFNRRLDMNIFSQMYESFEDVQCPVETWNGPQLHFEWELAKEQAEIDFIAMQAEILKRYVDAPVGTDLMPLGNMDLEAIARHLDVVQFNHYNRPDNLIEAAFWFDHFRTLLDRPYWNTETSTTWPGGIKMGFPLPPEGFCRVNTWLAVALGGECAMYWLWRQHWAGHELMHGSVLSPSGRPVYSFGEVQRCAEEFRAAADFVNGTKVATDVALHFTATNAMLFAYQKIVRDTNYAADVIHIHTALTKRGIRPDVIGASHTLAPYKVLFSPLMMTMEDGDLPRRIREWVADGGVWVVGPMSDVRNDIGAHYTNREMGFVEDMLGIELTYLVPTDGTDLSAAWSDGTPLTARRLAECYTTRSENALAAVTGGHSALVGKTLVAQFSYGHGRVILVGTLLEGDDLARIIELAVGAAGAARYRASGSVVVVPRAGDAGEGVILAEVGHEPGTVFLDAPMRELLTGETYPAGETAVAPYAVHVLRRI